MSPLACSQAARVSLARPARSQIATPVPRGRGERPARVQRVVRVVWRRLAQGSVLRQHDGPWLVSSCATLRWLYTGANCQAPGHLLHVRRRGTRLNVPCLQRPLARRPRPGPEGRAAAGSPEAAAATEANGRFTLHRRDLRLRRGVSPQRQTCRGLRPRPRGQPRADAVNALAHGLAARGARW